jgi:SAM-dependent methyltransferase
VPEPLAAALAALRPLLLDDAHLVRAIAAGRRRDGRPEHQRAELRPVDLKAGRRLQLVTTDGRQPRTRNLRPGPQAEVAVDGLLGQPFGNWLVETEDQVVQLRVTKRGMAQVHSAPRSADHLAGSAGRRAHDRVKAHLLDAGDPLFDALGAGADKRRQVEAFLRLLAPAMPRAVESAREAGRGLRVVDLGCGNAYLTFAAHRWLSAGGAGAPMPVRTLGVDLREDAVARNTRLAAELGLDGLLFTAGAIGHVEPVWPAASAGPGGEPATDEGIDLVLALHACDTATDEALARAVRWEAPVIMAAPCCHHDVQRQIDAGRREGRAAPEPYGALWRDGILRERLADVLTDGLRAALLRLLGYRVEVVEFVESRHTPRNALIRAVRTGARPDDRRRAEYRDLADSWRVRPALEEMLADHPVVAELRR